jgi:hypothetical protein
VIRFESEVPEAKGLVADRRLFVAAAEPTVVDARPGQLVVEEGDPRAAFLLAAPGSLIPEAQVQALGLELVDGKIVQRSPDAAKPAEPPMDAEPAPAEPPRRRPRAPREE